MKSSVRFVTDGSEGFFRRAKETARTLDRGETPGSEITVGYESPDEMMRVLSAARVRVLESVKEGAKPIPVLARKLKRNLSAVKRDVVILEKAGLVSTRLEVNAGHGKHRVVAPLAARYHFSLTI
jgi:predicted transcriptional regulator